jgi:hypothetical protein
VSTIGWPNQASPGLAQFELDVPDDWTAAETPEALLALLGPEHDGFRPNIVVFGRRADISVGVADVADQTIADNGALEIGEGSDRPATDSELAIAVRRASAMFGEIAVNQLIVAVAAEDFSPAGLRSLYVLLGTFLAARTEDDEPIVKAVISSFRTRTDTPEPDLSESR